MKVSQPKDDQRAAILQKQQRLKMARSAQAYVRGSTVKFYEWLEAAKGKVPEGPPSGYAVTVTWVILGRGQIVKVGLRLRAVEGPQFSKIRIAFATMSVCMRVS